MTCFHMMTILHVACISKLRLGMTETAAEIHTKFCSTTLKTQTTNCELCTGRGGGRSLLSTTALLLLLAAENVESLIVADRYADDVDSSQLVCAHHVSSSAPPAASLRRHFHRHRRGHAAVSRGPRQTGHDGRDRVGTSDRVGTTALHLTRSARPAALYHRPHERRGISREEAHQSIAAVFSVASTRKIKLSSINVRGSTSDRPRFGVSMPTRARLHRCRTPRRTSCRASALPMT